MSIYSNTLIQKPSRSASYALNHRILRALFAITWLICARWTPTQFRLWRIVILKMFGAKIPYSANIYASAKIWYPPNLNMARNSTLGPNTFCYCTAPVFIGENTVISQNVTLCTGSHDITLSNLPLIHKTITIEDQVWIGMGAFVGPGVTIHSGAVLGAMAVAMTSIAQNTVSVGNPAKFLRYRNSC